ncbi:hypothetical protein [Moritella sp. Urea-trap-13]|uniref:hypothetical protein n=1 Tax=Moritella sp. Urea-trap-13 TaxID=2058327 RepID=UPI000C3218C1|nr:hypothetical protein [Moritella sp. Urea-trap-13]PKH07236.1 hypothetical protein CXF93_13095 [Moritella sp. Urea-trap-13]
MFMEIGILLFLFSLIIFAIIKQTKKMISTKKRQILSKHYKRITDTDAVLKYATSLSFNARLIILLHERVVSSLHAILAVDPKHENVKINISQHRSHISTAKITQSTGVFVEPSDERIAIDLARSISRLKNILRDELTQKNITLEDCLAEEKKLEQLRFKLRLSNCLIKAELFFQQEKYSITEKMLTDNLALLESIEVKDEYLIEKFNKMTILLNKANFEVSLIELQKESEEKEIPNDQTSLEALFEQKQKHI